MESADKRIEKALVALLGIVTVALASVLGCRERCCETSEQVQQMSQKTIVQVQEEHTGQWMAIRGVVGTAIGSSEGKPCIKIFTAVPAKQIRAKIPTTVEGYPVVIEETGVFRALGQQ